MRLIDADALLKAISEYPYGIRGMIETEIAIQKTVDAVHVRHGKWIDGYILDEPIEVCSECNTFYMLKFSGGGMRYCPNCGARMDEE